MGLGIVFGILMSYLGYNDFVTDWISPFGTIFISLLKMIAIPLIVASLIKGISDLEDIAKFSKIGIQTIVIYVITTVIAVSIGLTVVHIINPGNAVSESTIADILDRNGAEADSKISTAAMTKDQGPLQFIEDLVPSNVFGALSDNGSMLKVIFFVVFFGICLLLIKKEHRDPLHNFFVGLNEVILKMVDLIMLYAPYGVFALLANLVVSTTNPDLFIALGMYALTVVLGLLLMLGFYLIIVKTITGRSPGFFFKGIGPAQLVAFSTSSSAATLPVTMERVEEHLGVDEEVASFVCPVGATINMDGTSLYQAVAAVFIAQALGFDLSIGMIATILATSVLASIGSAAVPGAGLIMLIIVLQSINFPADKLAIGIAMVMAVDRPLDMLRTVINISGDATVSMVVAKRVGKLGDPNVKDWDDNYQKG
ncbi:glutamate:proton symporter [Portibacter lacus]|uniref:Glutamate:proton symporter n=2 Tax=Portibacter lacus TaxID=1099794 RepID=A0AA37SR55_9BACT|nr:glutamate:proton symporter [Portibacter lacus]